jgi:hypothetical protein
MTDIRNPRNYHLFHRLGRAIQRQPWLWALRLSALLLIILLLGSNWLVKTLGVTLAGSTVLSERSIASARENMEALGNIPSTPADIPFGFAPLLLQPDSRVIILTQREAQTARLVYPQQAANPAEWLAADSFAVAYAVRQELRDKPQVSRVALGTFNVMASSTEFFDFIDHTAAWVTFEDRTRAVVDLTPLGVRFGAIHHPKNLNSTARAIERRFAARREGVDLNHLQPLKVIEHEGKLYYLLTKVLVYPDRYEFILQVHAIQPAGTGKPLRLLEGTRIVATLGRVGFEQTQALLQSTDLTSLGPQQNLLVYQGSQDPLLHTILREHLDLLAQLILKLESSPAPKVYE